MASGSLTGDSVELEVRLPHEHRICIVCVNIRSYGVNVEIHMPREGRVDLRTGDGSIGLRNFKGDMQLESSDGS